MSFDADIQEVASTTVDATKELTSFAGTIMSVSPDVTVQTDGSGVAIPVKVADFVSVVVGRRCLLQRFGKDTVLTNTYGGNTLSSLNVTGTLTTSGPTSVTSPTGSGSFTNVSGYAAPSTPCGIVFQLPNSGRSLILVKGRLVNTSGVATIMYLSTEIRLGSSIGAGTVVLSPTNGRAIGGSAGASAEVITGGRGDIFTGTPGQTYNVQGMVICTSGSANDVDSANVEVIPVA